MKNIPPLPDRMTRYWSHHAESMFRDWYGVGYDPPAMRRVLQRAEKKRGMNVVIVHALLFFAAVAFGTISTALILTITKR